MKALIVLRRFNVRKFAVKIQLQAVSPLIERRQLPALRTVQQLVRQPV